MICKNQFIPSCLLVAGADKYLAKLNFNFRKVKAHVQRKIINIKENWWNKIAINTHEAYYLKDSKNLLFFLLIDIKSMVLCKQHLLLCGRKTITWTDRQWMEHYSELLNHPSPVNIEYISQMCHLPIIHLLTEMTQM